MCCQLAAAILNFAGYCKPLQSISAAMAWPWMGLIWSQDTRLPSMQRESLDPANELSNAFQCVHRVEVQHIKRRECVPAELFDVSPPQDPHALLANPKLRRPIPLHVNAVGINYV